MSTPVDLWFGYTQNSFWQAYNRAASSPFRETNYQPELMLTTPLNLTWACWTRYLTLGLNHQSNGQTSTLSRSWNRIYAEVGRRKASSACRSACGSGSIMPARTMTIDIADFMGHGDLQASYRADGHELSSWRAATSRSTARCNWAGPSRWRPI
jgi:phospholipase A1